MSVQTPRKGGGLSATVQLQAASWIELAEAKARAHHERETFSGRFFLSVSKRDVEVDEGDRVKSGSSDAHRARTTQDSPQAWAQPLLPTWDNGIPSKAAMIAGVARALAGGWLADFAHSPKRSGAKRCARKWRWASL